MNINGEGNLLTKTISVLEGGHVPMGTLVLTLFPLFGN